MELLSTSAQQTNSGPKGVNPGLASALIEGFNWAETTEGHAYWEQLYWQLLGLPVGRAPQ